MNMRNWGEKQMRKTISLLLILILTLSLMVGCGKKDEAKELDLGKVEEENEGEVIEANKDEESIPQEIDYILYLKYKDKPFLYDDMFTVNIDDERLRDKSVEEFVLNELINYSMEGNFESPIPAETEVLNIERQGKTVIVDLSEEFMNVDNKNAKLALGGLVNSLVVLPGNESVRIKIEGSLIDDYNGIDISQPLYFYEDVFADK